MPFAEREHAQDIADQWNVDHADASDAVRTEGWSEDKIKHLGAVGPEERETWTGGGAVWTRVPDRQFVHRLTAPMGPDATLDYEPLSMNSLWVWEFESDSYTRKSAELRTVFRPGGSTESHARGTNKSAVTRAFEQAQAKTLEVCAKHPERDLNSAVT
ncbi:hypothetical protein [Streptomyces sp. NPDC088725]|uniref:hypothetical protein n=1 Tax=Streptomyces sp. NPDC088725 TaxID=3365873 RepID=UPI00380150A4